MQLGRSPKTLQGALEVKACLHVSPRDCYYGILGVPGIPEGIPKGKDSGIPRDSKAGMRSPGITWQLQGSNGDRKGIGALAGGGASDLWEEGPMRLAVLTEKRPEGRAAEEQMSVFENPLAANL